MRLIDLDVDWLLQYTPETTVFDPAFYPGVAMRSRQLDGYLQSTKLAILACSRRFDDWARQADPWRALGDLITRVEAEFPGRLLIGSDDFDRWRDDRDGLAWGMVGVKGFDALIRSSDDLARLPGLFERGVRLFQPIHGETSPLGGSSTPGDHRGLTELGRGFLETLLDFSPSGPGPRPLLDLADMNASTMADVLGWFEADSPRALRVVPLVSHGAPALAGSEPSSAITLENFRQLRALGGTVGVTPSLFQTSELFKKAIDLLTAIPFEGREGWEGIAIGTDFLGVDGTLPGLGNAGEVVAWVQANFDRAAAKDLLHDNALTLISRVSDAEQRL